MILDSTKTTIDDLKAEIKVVKLNLQSEVAKRQLANVSNEQHENIITQLKQDIMDLENKNKILL